MNLILKKLVIRIITIYVLFFLNTINAQQNLFNIPSGDITNKGKIFYQHQFNLYSHKLESKAHFVYGLGSDFDIGANIVGKGLYFSPDWRILHNDNPNKGAVYPIFMGTIQKKISVAKNLDVNVGAQLGWNLSDKINNKEINYFTYTIATYHFLKSSRIVGGLYKTNEMFVGDAKTFGILAGYEIKVAKRFYIMGDWISGNNDASVLVLGAMANVSKRVQLCAGWQIPNTNTPKPAGLVLEVNIMGWNLY